MKRFILTTVLFILSCGKECYFDESILIDKVWMCTDGDGEVFGILFKSDGTGSSILFGYFNWRLSDCAVEILGSKITIMEITYMKEDEFSFIFDKEGDKIVAICQREAG